jgi:uncharacterized protein (DUF697 family)
VALSVLKDIRKVYAGLNADAIRGAAAQDINVGLMASSEDSFRRMRDFLVSTASDEFTRARAVRAIHRAEGAPRRFDFLLYDSGVPRPANGYLFGEEGRGEGSQALISAIVADHQGIETALAKTFPGFRTAVADRIVLRVARENALFSIVTALPNVVPNLFELPLAVGEFATDTAFLTMNQIRMALTLAAAYGRPTGYMEQKVQIAGIVAGAFGWRAIARELVGKIPLGGGLIPKAAVAFAGTYAVGLGLRQLNRSGGELSRQERRDAYTEAFVKGRDTARELVPDLAQNKENSVRR